MIRIALVKYEANEKESYSTEEQGQEERQAIREPLTAGVQSTASQSPARLCIFEANVT